MLFTHSRKSPDRKSNNFWANFNCTIQTISILKTDRMEPADDGECNDTFYVRIVEHSESLWASSKGIVAAGISSISPQFQQIVKTLYQGTCTSQQYQ